MDTLYCVDDVISAGGLMMTMSYKKCIAAVLTAELLVQAFEDDQPLHKKRLRGVPVVPGFTGSLNMNRRFVYLVTFVVSDGSG
jgi:hypothetical protein